ncbi:MAG: hypothetical protein HeimC3_10640 [Candidatus Heimdallarchaeota archaeon LC_3]|nr:MAG: hypothetical protein HeimC3_10640 [Candidatus Heimdallarchaeota archaeon LC_3]
MEDLKKLFKDIKNILEKYSEGLSVKTEYIDSQAKIKKPSYHLYGKKEVSVSNKKPQQTYICGVIQQKNYVSFYLSVIYSHPELKEKINPELVKFLKSKSCFNINKSFPSLLNNIDEILSIGINKYKVIEWI